MRDGEREIGGLFETIGVCDPFTSEGQPVPEAYGGGSTAEVVELEDAAAELDGSPTRISTISNRASVVTTADQADRLISAFFLSCWLLSTTRTSRPIRSRSTSLSSGNDSWAMSMASWMCERKVVLVRSGTSASGVDVKDVRRSSARGQRTPFAKRSCM